jgi:site-specific recombinase XerD
MHKGLITSKGDNIPQTVVEFLYYLRSVKGKSENTIDGYKIDLSIFFKFMKQYKGGEDENDRLEDIIIHDIDIDFISSIKLPDIYAFINYITIVRKNGSNARARKTAAIKSYYNYMVNKVKLLDENPSLELEAPKIGKHNPVYLTLNESRQLLNAIDGKYKERDYAIITLFLNCGLRLSELVGIDLGDIKGDALTVRGKGNKERAVYLNKACEASISDYMDIRFDMDVPKECRALFISQRKSRISKRTVQHIVDKYLEKAELTGENYSVHKLRHTAATLMYKYGNVDIRTLQQILGHESVSTTEIYTHVDDEQVRVALNKNPLAEETK